MSYPDFGPRCDPANGHKGTLYVIDELHNYFGARNWQATGTDCTFYLSQHRKMGDDVLLISQHPDQVDKALRRLCQDFTVLVNLGKTKLFGFTFPGFGRRNTFANQGDRQPIESGTYRMNIGEYGKLYDTNAGAGGIVGRTDLKEKGGGGMSPLLIPVFVVAIVLACWFVPKLVFAGMGTVAKQAASGLDVVVDKGTNGMQKMFQKFSTNAPAPFVVSNVTSVPVVVSMAGTNTNTLTIVRRVILGANRTYWLSDGRRISQDDPMVKVAAEDYIVLEGGNVIWKQ